MPIDSPDRFEQRHIGPDDKQQADMLRVIGMRSLDALIDAAIPRSIRLEETAAAAACRVRARISRSAPHRRRKKSALQVLHRNGLLPDDHAQRDPQVSVREPVVVYALHAVSGGDRAGPTGVAPQLPDDGERPDGDGDRDGIPPRRSDGSRRSDDASASPAGPRLRGEEYVLGFRCAHTRRYSMCCAAVPSRWVSTS